MKYIILLFVMVATVVPGVAHADDSEPQEFLYAFHIQWSAGAPAWVGQYTLTTGEQVTPTPGTWAFRIVNERGAILGEYPVAPLQRGATDMVIPYIGSGFRAVLVDASGVVRLDTDLSGSRVCNDDGACDGQYGEDGSNCATDCTIAARSTQTAAIAEQIPFGRQLGAWLVRLSFAAAGLLLLGSAIRALDSRKRPYDN